MPDPGMQNERNALAWQRTALSLVVASAVIARLSYERIGLVAAVAGALGLAACGWVFWESSSRYRHHAGVRIGPPRGGRSGVALAMTVTLLAATELVTLVVADRS